MISSRVRGFFPAAARHVAGTVLICTQERTAFGNAFRDTRFARIGTVQRPDGIFRERTLRRLLRGEPELEGWLPARTERIDSGFYMSQALELIRT